MLYGKPKALSNTRDRTLVITFSQSCPLLATALGKPDSSVAFIMPERLARAAAGKPVTEMVGSGPYRFVADEYVNGGRVVYHRFDKYVSRAEPAVWATGAKQDRIDAGSLLPSTHTAEQREHCFHNVFYARAERGRLKDLAKRDVGKVSKPRS